MKLFLVWLFLMRTFISSCWCFFSVPAWICFSIFTSSLRPWLVFFLFIFTSPHEDFQIKLVSIFTSSMRSLIDFLFLTVLYSFPIIESSPLTLRAFIQWQPAGSSSITFHLAAKQLTSPNWFICIALLLQGSFNYPADCAMIWGKSGWSWSWLTITVTAW